MKKYFDKRLMGVFLMIFVFFTAACEAEAAKSLRQKGLRVRPRIKRVGIADGFTVGSSLRRGGFPLCIGRDRNQHREQECQRQQGGLQPYKFTVHSFYSILSLCCGDIYK